MRLLALLREHAVTIIAPEFFFTFVNDIVIDYFSVIKCC